MKREKRERKKVNKASRGVLTVEAMLILPVYLLVITFVINFLNISYLQLTVQQGLNNAARTLAQHCYAVDLTVGMDKINETSLDDKADAVGTVITDAKNLINSAVDVLSNLSIEKIQNVIDEGKKFGETVADVATDLKSTTKEQFLGYLLTTVADLSTGALVEVQVEEYLGEMKVNRNMLDGDITYQACMDEDNNIVLFATYRYKSGLFSMFIDGIDMQQSVVVHPWIGGSTEAVRGKGALL